MKLPGENKCSIITAKLATTSQTISVAKTVTKVNLNSYTAVGDKLSFDTTNKGIKIGAGVKYVLVSGNLTSAWSGPVTEDFTIVIKKNNEELLRVPAYKNVERGRCECSSFTFTNRS